MKFIDKKGIKGTNLFCIFFFLAVSIILGKGYEVHCLMNSHIPGFGNNSSIMAGPPSNPLVTMSSISLAQIGNYMPLSIPINSPPNIPGNEFLSMLPQPGVNMMPFTPSVIPGGLENMPYQMIPFSISPFNMMLSLLAPPGIAPKGMSLPGIIPPDMMPLSMVPSGMMPPDIVPPMMIPPGMMPLEMMPLNIMSPRMTPPGMTPPGMMPPGMMPPGMMPIGPMLPNFVPPIIPVEYFPRSPVNPNPIINNNPPSNIVNFDPPKIDKNTYFNVPDGKKRYVEAEVLVVFKPGVSLSQKMSIHDHHNCVLKYICPLAGYHKVGIPNGKTVEQMIMLYREEKFVLFAEPNLIRYPDQLPITPNDPYYPLQWHLPSINADLAWNFGDGTGVTVAVLDTGITQTAPDFAGTAFIPGWNFINANEDTTDYDGHGTRMAGTIAQTTNNSIGCASVAYGCTIMPVKVGDDSGIIYLSSEISGIYFAINNGAQIINMSFGGEYYSSIEEATIAYAYNSGLTLVASAGNDPNIITHYPSQIEECIAVSALDVDDTIAFFSAFGPSIDLSAPGNYIYLQTLDYDPLIDTFDFSYGYYYGTSEACAIVSGVAALIIGKSTILLTSLDVRNILQNTAVDLGDPGVDVYFGYGKVDAYNALLNTP